MVPTIMAGMKIAISATGVDTMFELMLVEATLELVRADSSLPFGNRQVSV